MRRLIIVTFVLLLAGCAGENTMLQASADLVGVAPIAMPLEPGLYTSAADDLETNRMVIWGSDGYKFELPSQQDFAFRLFGPVEGLYIAQFVFDDRVSTDNSYVIAKIDGDYIYVASGDLRLLAGTYLFDKLGIQLEDNAGPSVAQLTSNAALNWGILRGFIAEHKSDLRFELFLTRTGD